MLVYYGVGGGGGGGGGGATLHHGFTNKHNGGAAITAITLYRRNVSRCFPTHKYKSSVFS